MSVRRRGERGSMAVEVVILAPVLMMMGVLVVAAGRWVSVEGDIDAAVRDAARAASLHDSRSEAVAAANATKQASLENLDYVSCPGDVEFGGTWAAGGSVVVRIRCTVSYEGLGLIGLPGSTSIEAESSVPLDPYRELTP